MSTSTFLRVRGLRLHLRHFGSDNAPLLFLLHGWLDASASFAPMIEALLARAPSPLRVIAPDWRGCGYSEWAPAGYWFPDYLADFDAIADHCAPGQAFSLVGHSMGAQVASLYAGVRPQRVRKLALLDGLALPDTPPERAPERLLRWLTQLREPPRHHPYPSFEALAERIRRHHPRLSAAQADLVARCWGDADGHGRVRLLADPQHRLQGPGLYRVAESMVVWRRITAPTLFLQAGESAFHAALPADEWRRRQACFGDHRSVTLDGVGHMLQFEAPQASAAALAEFLWGPPCA